MATEDITSGGDLAATYPLAHGGNARKPTGLPADYSDQHGFHLPGKAEDHMRSEASAGVYSAEKSLDRYGGDGDDDGPPEGPSDEPAARKQSDASKRARGNDDEHDYRD